MAMIDELERTMGVRVVMFTGYHDRKGELVKTMLVALIFLLHNC